MSQTLGPGFSTLFNFHHTIHTSFLYNFLWLIKFKSIFHFQFLKYDFKKKSMQQNQELIFCSNRIVLYILNYSICCSLKKKKNYSIFSSNIFKVLNFKCTDLFYLYHILNDAHINCGWQFFVNRKFFCCSVLSCYAWVLLKVQFLKVLKKWNTQKPNEIHIVEWTNVWINFE